MSLKPPFYACLAAACGFLLLSLGAPRSPAAAAAQGDFANLQVLPGDIGQRQLIDTMKGIAEDLGVRCWHCHVGEEGADLSTYDFASDEKPTKRKARVMLKMTREINLRYLPEVDPEARVTCGTCHRGQPKPTAEAP